MWFWWAILSVILSSILYIFYKHTLKKISPVVMTWTLSFFPTIILLFFLPYGEKIEFNFLFWVGVVGSAITYVFGKIWQFQSLSQGLLSKLIPLTSFSVLFTYLLGLIFLGEHISTIPIIGIFFIISGSYILNADTISEHLLKPMALLFTNKQSFSFILAILLMSITSIFDKTGLTNMHPSNPYVTLLMESIIMTIPLTIYLQVKQHGWLTQVKNNIFPLIAVALLFTFSVIFSFKGFVIAPIALTVAITQLKTFLVLLLSILFFNDKPTKHIWIGTLIMILGVVLVKVG